MDLAEYAFGIVAILWLLGIIARLIWNLISEE